MLTHRRLLHRLLGVVVVIWTFISLFLPYLTNTLGFKIFGYVTLAAVFAIVYLTQGDFIAITNRMDETVERTTPVIRAIANAKLRLLLGYVLAGLGLSFLAIIAGIVSRHSIGWIIIPVFLAGAAPVCVAGVLITEAILTIRRLKGSPK